MPCYFIDTDDGRSAVADDEGHDLLDDAAARGHALHALADMAQSGLAHGASTGADRRTFSARVRMEDGGTLYSASLTLSGDWRVRSPSA